MISRLRNNRLRGNLLVSEEQERSGPELTPQIWLGVLDLVKGLAWPFVVLLLALMFRTEPHSFVEGMLKRFREGKFWGVEIEIEVDAADQQQKTGALAKSDVTAGTIELKEFPGLGWITFHSAAYSLSTATNTKKPGDLRLPASKSTN